MNIDLAADAPFENNEAFLDFLGQNEFAHLTFGRYLAQTGYVVTATPPLGNPKETVDWFADHYQRHVDECSTLNIDVPDLSAVDFTQEDQYLDWMQTHSDLHDQQNAALGITS